jgi:hypothetical protein
MAVAVVVNKMSVYGDRRCHNVTLTFSGNYPDEGEAITAAALGLQGGVLDNLFFDGVAIAADGETAIAPKYLATTAAAGVVLFFESAATGLAFLEKTGAEAYPTGCVVKAMAIGY